jgi:hypothetical protein
VQALVDKVAKLDLTAVSVNPHRSERTVKPRYVEAQALDSYLQALASCYELHRDLETFSRSMLACLWHADDLTISIQEIGRFRNALLIAQLKLPSAELTAQLDGKKQQWRLRLSTLQTLKTGHLRDSHWQEAHSLLYGAGNIKTATIGQLVLNGSYLFGGRSSVSQTAVL